MAKNVSCQVTVTFDHYISNLFIPESKWTQGTKGEQNCNKFPQCVHEISHSQEWD